MSDLKAAVKAPRLARRRLPRWARLGLLALALPLLALGLICLHAAYTIYLANRAVARLPAFPAPASGQRLLVFSPHPDDETLGAAGLIRQARGRGDDVRVVFLTNGDGFAISAAREFHEIAVPPADFVRYGTLRQGESRTALGLLGVAPDAIHFLGYPDRGLLPMWTDHWDPSRPVASAFTRDDHSPYDNSPTPHAPYCGAALLADVRAQMQADRPTDIYVTHPNDDHPDHAAASAFVRAALDQLKEENVPWAQAARLHFYLVHRGDWPVPQGLNEAAPLLPPGQMAALDTHWSALSLSKRDVQRKYAAIKRYRTQVSAAGRFLLSFARRNELFGTLGDANAAPALAVVPPARMHLDGRIRADWAGLAPVALDPAGDSVLRAVQPSADILRLYACRDGGLLYVRLDADAPLTPQVAYTFVLRPLPPSQGPPPSPALTVTVSPGPPGRRLPLPGVPGGSYAWRGASLEAALPLAPLGLQSPPPGTTLYLLARTRCADMEADRTGFRPVLVR